ncbi:hypothetical protein ONZ45_g17135 [Pleurotus djamor]|nr:hypothetical protein ONZ45_g17135 [Pleurotus djamor]
MVSSELDDCDPANKIEEQILLLQELLDRIPPAGGLENWTSRVKAIVIDLDSLGNSLPPDSAHVFIEAKDILAHLQATPKMDDCEAFRGALDNEPDSSLSSLTPSASSPSPASHSQRTFTQLNEDSEVDEEFKEERKYVRYGIGGSVFHYGDIPEARANPNRSDFECLGGCPHPLLLSPRYPYKRQGDRVWRRDFACTGCDENTDRFACIGPGCAPCTNCLIAETTCSHAPHSLSPMAQSATKDEEQVDIAQLPTAEYFPHLGVVQDSHITQPSTTPQCIQYISDTCPDDQDISSPSIQQSIIPRETHQYLTGWRGLDHPRPDESDPEVWAAYAQYLLDSISAHEEIIRRCKEEISALEYELVGALSMVRHRLSQQSIVDA